MVTYSSFPPDGRQIVGQRRERIWFGFVWRQVLVRNADGSTAWVRATEQTWYSAGNAADAG